SMDGVENRVPWRDLGSRDGAHATPLRLRRQRSEPPRRSPGPEVRLAQRPGILRPSPALATLSSLRPALHAAASCRIRLRPPPLRATREEEETWTSTHPRSRRDCRRTPTAS